MRNRNDVIDKKHQGGNQEYSVKHEYASAKTMLRETGTTRHRCGFATSVDCKSKRPRRAQQPRLQEHMLQVNKQGEWRDVVVRVVPKVHLPERVMNITPS